MRFFKKRQDTNNGFTLFSFLIYIAISGIILIAVSDLTVNMLFLSARIKTEESKNYMVSFLHAKLGYELGTTETIITPTYNNVSNTLVTEKNGTQTTYKVDQGRLWAEEQGVSPRPLTPVDVVVQETMFYRVSDNTLSPVVLELKTATHNSLRRNVLDEHATTTLTWYPYEYE